MKREVTELDEVTLFGDKSKDYVDENTGDYHFFIAGNQYKFRRAKYKLQRRIVNTVATIDPSDIGSMEDAQDFIFSMIWLKQGNSWALLEEDEMEEHLKNVEFRPITYLNVLFSVLVGRLIPNFTDAGMESEPATSSPTSVDDSNDTTSQRKLLTT